MQLSVGQKEFYQDTSPPDKKSPELAKVTKSSTGDQEKEIEGFKMYPNPVTNGFVNIVSKRNLSKEIRIYDVLANEVLRTTIGSTSLNVSRLDPGVYLLKVIESDQQVTRKLVIR
ncbi:T9SS type A sorting domain-containing protein [Flavobacteriaceae bacterium R38]|nr:T9SS type A sorting domain-containing protein [Flavobacteriaceae bacterium R38]